MVPRHGERGADLSQFAALHRPGGGVVHMFCASPQPPLKRVGIFPQIMCQPGELPLFLRAESRGKPGAQLRCSTQVLLNCLLSFIL